MLGSIYLHNVYFTTKMKMTVWAHTLLYVLLPSYRTRVRIGLTEHFFFFILYGGV